MREYKLTLNLSWDYVVGVADDNMSEADIRYTVQNVLEAHTPNIYCTANDVMIKHTQLIENEITNFELLKD